MCSEEYTTIDIELTEDIEKFLNEVSAETGFTIDRIVEYILGEQIINKAIKSIKYGCSSAW